MNAASSSRHIALSFLGNLFPPMAVLVTSPVLARSLGVDARGDLAAATAPFLLAVAIGTLGIPDAVTNAFARRSSLSRRTWATVSAALLAAAATAVLVIWLASPVLSAGGAPDLAIVMTVATAATAPGLIVALLRGSAMGSHRWGLVAGERVLNGLLRMAGIVGFALAGQLTLVTATAVTVLGPVVAGVAYLGLATRSAGTLRPFVGSTSTRAVMGYGMRAWLGSVAGILLMRIDQLLILPLAGPTQLGLYAVAVNVSEVPLIINSATREVMFSSDAAERDNAKASLAARTTFVACLLFSLVVFAPIEWWLPLLFGEEFRGAIPVALLACVAVLVGVPGSIAGSTLSARGRPELRSYSILVACIVNLVVLILVLPSWGGMGAAFATLVGNLISSNMVIAWAVRLHGFRWGDFYRVRASDLAALVNGVCRLLRRS